MAKLRILDMQPAWMQDTILTALPLPFYLPFHLTQVHADVAGCTVWYDPQAGPLVQGGQAGPGCHSTQAVRGSADCHE